VSDTFKFSACNFSPLVSSLFQTCVTCNPSQQLKNQKLAAGSRQATEPVFSMAEGISFGNFRSVFRTGFEDPALLNALMLSLAFAAGNGSLDSECLAIKTRALRIVGERLSNMETATTGATIGAILLLVGVEARLGLRSQVQLHLAGVKRLLVLCGAAGVQLTDGVKRAIFW
jgi:hypothetical protein